MEITGIRDLRFPLNLGFGVLGFGVFRCCPSGLPVIAESIQGVRKA